MLSLIERSGIESRGRKYVVDEHLKICNICGRGWEYVNKRLYHVDYIIYPIGTIPKIGKEKLPCPQCGDKHDTE